MAKFINNSDIAQQNRRIAASGMDPRKVLEVLRSLSEQRLPTEGVFSGNETKSSKDMASEISHIENYRGGYMYQGGYAYLNGEEILRYRTHWVKSYDSRDPKEFLEHNSKVLQEAAQGSTLRVGFSGDTSAHEDYRKEGDQWVSIGGYDGRDYDCARQHMDWRGFYLWAGIRKEVAEILGYQYDDCFHSLFDQVIEQTI